MPSVHGKHMCMLPKRQRNAMPCQCHREIGRGFACSLSKCAKENLMVQCIDGDQHHEAERWMHHHHHHSSKQERLKRYPRASVPDVADKPLALSAPSDSRAPDADLWIALSVVRVVCSPFLPVPAPSFGLSIRHC